MNQLILFGILSLLIVIVSWRTLFSLKSHGFYRFLSWECIIWLLGVNYKFWYTNPFSIKQLISWIFLLGSGILVIWGIVLMKSIGKPGKKRSEKVLYKFEQTSELIDSGIFKYIRHPLYSSLLFLTWGIFLKNTTDILFVVSLLSTIFLYLTAIMDERECIKFFGSRYRDYMKRSKRFIPYLL